MRGAFVSDVEIERLAAELHERGLAQTATARRTYRESFATLAGYADHLRQCEPCRDEPLAPFDHALTFTHHMRRLAQRGAQRRLANAKATRRRKLAERLGIAAYPATHAREVER